MPQGFKKFASHKNELAFLIQVYDCHLTLFWNSTCDDISQLSTTLVAIHFRFYYVSERIVGEMPPVRHPSRLNYHFDVCRGDAADLQSPMNEGDHHNRSIPAITNKAHTGLAMYYAIQELTD